MAVVVNADTSYTKRGTERVELLDDKVDRYNPGVQLFKLLGIGGLQNNTTAQEENTIPVDSFIMNKDMTPFQNHSCTVKRAAVMKIKLPKSVTKTYPKEKGKYIPVGTIFLADFSSEDFTKIKIIGGAW